MRVLKKERCRRLGELLPRRTTRSLHNEGIDNSMVAFGANGQTFGNGINLVDEPLKRNVLVFLSDSISPNSGGPRWPGMFRAPPSVADLVIIEYNVTEWIRLDQYLSSKLSLTRILHCKELPKTGYWLQSNRPGWKEQSGIKTLALRRYPKSFYVSRFRSNGTD